MSDESEPLLPTVSTTQRTYVPRVIAAALAAVSLVAVAYVGLSKPMATESAMPEPSSFVSLVTGSYGRNTGGNANDGNIIYLDRHSLRCVWGTVMRQFRASTGGGFHYDYNCGVNNVVPVTGQWQYGTGLQETGGVIYLDRQNVQCPDNTLLSGFWGRTQDWWGRRFTYDYTCDAYASMKYDCAQYYTNWNDPGNNIIYLDRHNVECPGDRPAMKGFKGETGSCGWWCTVFRYSYTCCNAYGPDPTAQPIASPTANPIAAPTQNPTPVPIAKPTEKPIANPTAAPIADPTQVPTQVPIANPTANPVADPTMEPIANPSPAPVADPTMEPTVPPIAHPTLEPTLEPSGSPQAGPTNEPIAHPTLEPTVEPTHKPVSHPTDEPTREPSHEPTVKPVAEPTMEPTLHPVAHPTHEPSKEPTKEPIAHPTTEPSQEPTQHPISVPTDEPTKAPTDGPTEAPTDAPVGAPTLEPTLAPTMSPFIPAPPADFSKEEKEAYIEKLADPTPDIVAPASEPVVLSGDIPAPANPVVEIAEEAAAADEAAAVAEEAHPGKEHEESIAEAAADVAGVEAPVDKSVPVAADIDGAFFCKFTYTKAQGPSKVPMGCALVSASNVDAMADGEISPAAFICSSSSADLKVDASKLTELGLIVGGDSTISYIKPGSKTSITWFVEDSFAGQKYTYTSGYHPTITNVHMPGSAFGNDAIKSLIMKSSAIAEEVVTPDECS